MKYVILLAVLCLTCGVAMAGPGIPVQDGGVVWVVPVGNGADGDRAAPFYSGTLTADVAICGEPEAITNPLHILQLVAANTRLEMLIYPGQNMGDTDINATGGLSLLLESAGAIPAKIGGTWAPYTEWDAGWYAGLNLLNLATPSDPLLLAMGGTDVTVTRLTMGPQYSGGRIGLGVELAGTF